MRVFSLLSLLVLLLAIPLGAPRAEERLHVDIRGSGGRDYQVAVQRFATLAAADRLRDDFYTQLARAIEFSSLLVLVKDEAFLEPLITQDYESSTIPCDNWRGIGADALVEGELSIQGDTLAVRAKIWDAVRCRMQGRAVKKSGPLDTMKLIARSLADDIVERFTGRRGVSATQIAFVSDKNGNKEVFLMEADGSEKRQVTQNGAINLFPSWSPDGRSLVYTSFRSGRADLWMVSRGPNRGRKLLELPEAKYRGVWAPQDGTIAVVMSRDGNTDLFSVKKSGRGLKRLTRSRAIETSPTWSPDGEKLAFVSDRSGGSPQIYVKDLASGEERRLTFRGSYNASPAWSPTGEWIAYTAQTGSSFDLYLIDPETGFTTPLVIHPRSDEDPAWSPDGRKLVFSSNRRGRRDLYRIDVDGRHLQRLTDAFGEASNPAWSGWLD